MRYNKNTGYATSQTQAQFVTIHINNSISNTTDWITEIVNLAG